MSAPYQSHTPILKRVLLKNQTIVMGSTTPYLFDNQHYPISRFWFHDHACHDLNTLHVGYFDLVIRPDNKHYPHIKAWRDAVKQQQAHLWREVKSSLDDIPAFELDVLLVTLQQIHTIPVHYGILDFKQMLTLFPEGSDYYQLLMYLRYYTSQVFHQQTREISDRQYLNEYQQLMGSTSVELMGDLLGILPLQTIS